MFAVVTNVTREDFIIVSLQQSYIFSGFSIPDPANAIESCTEYEISFRIELNSCDFSLMAFQDIGATGGVHVIDPNYRVGGTRDQLVSSSIEIEV